jgi:hypothetical protein
MKEWEGYWRILQWNRLAQSHFEESAEVARQCRTAWKQICATVPHNSRLPKEFLYPFRGYLRNEVSAMELFDDERRLILCMSDLRDYLQLMRRKG